MVRERIGLDFDGTLTKFPPIIRFLVSVINSKTTPRFLYELFWTFLLYLPVFLNFERLKTLEEARKEFTFIIISGRKEGTPLIEQILLDYGYFYLFNDIITQRKESKMSSAEFKEKVCKALNVDWYFEDNRYTVWYLRNKGIKAIRV